MKLIIKSPLGIRRSSKTVLGTVEADEAYVGFLRLSRRTGATIRGLGVITEDVGVNRSTVELHARRAESWRDERGVQGRNAWIRFRLLDRHKHVRVVPAEAVAELARYDAEIDALQRQIAQKRADRATAVRAIWARSGKLGIDYLEEKAEASL